MNCFRLFRSKNHSTSTSNSPLTPSPSKLENTKAKTMEETVLQIPGAMLHLMEQGEAVELGRGDFSLVLLTEDNVLLAMVVKVGADLQWPLTKDEPVVKLDDLHYLFTLPGEDGEFLSYGVSFAKPSRHLDALDTFLKENSCFSMPASSSSSSSSSSNSNAVYWRDFAPRVKDYNSVMGKVIAGGTGEIVKGIFKCSNAYTAQVQKGGEMIQTRVNEGKDESSVESKSNKGTGRNKKSGVQKSVKRVRKLSKLTEKMSRALLNGVTSATGSVAAPLVRSQAGKAVLAMVPGEVLLASFDAVNKVLDAVEVAEKQAFSATSGAVAGRVSQRFGEDAGEVTEDVFATAGHCMGTAWNLFKIRKAINPASSMSSAILKNAVKKKT